jgi:hypothetical protein
VFSINAATFVTSCNTTKVRVLDFIVPRPPTQINANRISTNLIFSYILNFLRGRNDRLWKNLLCWYMFIINAMWSCNERTTLHCAYSYLYYIIWIKNFFFFRGNETRENIINTLEYRNNPKVTERRSNSEMNVYAWLNCHSCLISNELNSEWLLFTANPAISSYSMARYHDT